MTQKTRIQIAKAANIIIKEFDIDIPITNIDAIVVQLNGRIIEVSDQFVDDSIAKSETEDADFVITISSNLIPERRNFSIAQKLGTLFLHMGYMSDWEVWDSLDYKSYNTSTVDSAFEAHQFASHFLMPKLHFLDIVGAYAVDDIVDTKRVGNYFGVTDTVVINHGKWIGGLKW